VSVALRGRPGVAVVADMVDGVVAAASLTGSEAAVAREALWSVAAALLEDEINTRRSPTAPLAA